nr:PTS mannitol transporter subunit IIBC [Clostridium sp.]
TAVKDLKGTKKTEQEVKTYNKTLIKKIVFACDAGMGSSAMGASTLRNKLKKAGLNIEVINTAIEDIPEDADIVVSHESLTSRAKTKAPKVEHISITNFVSDPKYDKLIERLK